MSEFSDSLPLYIGHCTLLGYMVIRCAYLLKLSLKTMGSG